ncbi:MAG: hypothetical protein ACF8K1_08840 [Phycisphaerales bacterium JB047]
MGKKPPLPFARLVPRLPHCLRCGYPLEGIGAPGACPECGLAFEDGLSALMLTGVARTASGPAWRKASWVGLGVLGFLTLQGAALLILFAPWLGALMLVTFIVGVNAMIMTTRQKKSGTEHFVFTHEGLSRWTLGSDPTTRVFVEWSGSQRRATVRRVSPVWASIRIVAANEEGKAKQLLVGGFRCREEDGGLIEGVLNAMLLGEPICGVAGLEESGWYRSQILDQCDNPVDDVNNQV